MKTFAPYPNITQSVSTLSRLSLSEMRRSIIAILETLHEVEPQPSMPEDHPEIIKWKGHEAFLCEYAFAVGERYDEMVAGHGLAEHLIRGSSFPDRISYHLDCASSGEFSMAPPDWWGRTEFHIAEQAELLRQQPTWYAEYFEGVSILTPPAWMLLIHG